MYLLGTASRLSNQRSSRPLVESKGEAGAFEMTHGDWLWHCWAAPCRDGGTLGHERSGTRLAGGHVRTPRAVQHKASRPWLGNRSPHSSPSRSRGREKAGAQAARGPPAALTLPVARHPWHSTGSILCDPRRAPSPQLSHRVLANASEHGVLNLEA